MFPIDWAKLLADLVREGGGILFGALAGFFSAWVAFKFGIRRDVIKLQAELQNERERVRLERQGELVDGIWKKVRAALQEASSVTAMYKQYPDFKRLSEDATKEIVDSSRLSESEKKEFYSSIDRNKNYI